MHHKFGFDMPKAMHPEFGAVVQQESDRQGVELRPETIYELFADTYLRVDGPYQLLAHSFGDSVQDGVASSHFWGRIRHTDTVFEVNGTGNGPIDAFFNAIRHEKMGKYEFIDYKEHAISRGADSDSTRITARYSLPCALCTVSAQACSRSCRAS